MTLRRFKQQYRSFYFLISVLSVLLFATVQAQAQEGTDTSERRFKKEEVGIMHEQVLKGGLMAHTNGWGIEVLYARNKGRKKNTLYSFDYLFSLKHPKEAKVVNKVYEQANPYVYGRKNALMVARIGMGQQYRIADKEEDLGVRVDFNYTIGPNVGLLKPVYLELIRESPDGRLNVETEKYDPREHVNQGVIFGGASYMKGFGEIKFEPGISAKTSLSFAWGDHDEKFKSLETGIMVDAFYKKMPIFAFMDDEIDNKSVFINLYISFSFGTRW